MRRDAVTNEGARLREFWDERYREFTLSESGWLGAGEALNERLYACKRQALRHALRRRGLDRRNGWSVLDAGCGQGYFASFYHDRFPSAGYVGVDLSERAVDHLRGRVPGEFHVGDVSEWNDPQGRRFDVVQCFDVLHLILDDGRMAQAVKNLSAHLTADGALLVTAALPDATVQPSHSLRYRGRAFWNDLLSSLRLRIRHERPMSYWLPTGGPRNRYARFLLVRAGARTLYALDRTALALGFPRPRSFGVDCHVRLLTIQRMSA